MSHTTANPFPADPDRRTIWTMLVERDIDAFLACDWSRTAEDFAAEEFVGYAGPSNPDHWRIRFPTLEAYRDDWLRQAQAFARVALAGEDRAAFLHRATVLRDIEIQGDRALAHKKFDGAAATVGGQPVLLRFQTIYFLRRLDRQWRITSFLGYLPNPMPDAAAPAPGPEIRVPPGATQHVTAGPYSPVLEISPGTLVAISGQGPIDEQGRIVGSNIEEQTALTLANCRRQLASAGCSLNDVFKVQAYLADMAEWPRFNAVYEQAFQRPFPVRTAIQAGLWGGIKVELEMWALRR